MALKRKITKAEYDALSDALKGEYKAEGDNYVLDVEDAGFESLKAEKEAAKREADEAKRKLKEKEDAEAEAKRKAAEDKAKAAGDIAALEKSWKEKAERDAAAAREEGKRALEALRNITVNRTASEMAKKISTVPDLVEPLIRARLDVEITDGVPLIRVKDATGRPSALSVNDLEKEFLDNPAYKAVMKGSGSGGGGAGGAGEGGGAGRKKLSEMSATEEAKFANEHPEEYARMIGQS